MNKNALISLRGIRVDFDDEPVLKGIDLDIMDKEFITFLGPSGCGKTTLLHMIAGVITPDEGTVTVDGATRPVYSECRVIHLKLDQNTLRLIDAT